MKNILLLILAWSAPLLVYALQPGQNAMELTGVDWIQGKGFQLIPAGAQEPTAPAYRAVTFVQTRALNIQETLTVLNFLAEDYRQTALFAVVTPDTAADVKALLTGRGDFKAPFGSDSGRALTAQYMQGSPFYPRSFLVNARGRIVWSGDVVDLGEVLQSCVEGNFDAALQSKIAGHLRELELMLRENNDSRMAQLTRTILELQPGHPAALRMRMFYLENGNRSQEAWKLLMSQINAAPHLARLYFMAIEMVTRHPEFTPSATELGRAYLSKVKPDFDHDTQLTWMLLNLLPQDPDALVLAEQLLKRTAAQTSNQSGARQGIHLNSAALYAYRVGKPEAAIALQKRGMEMFRKNGLRGAAADAERRLLYYEKALECGRRELPVK